MYYLRLKMVISFLEIDIFRESLFSTFLLQKLHFDTSWTVLEKILSPNKTIFICTLKRKTRRVQIRISPNEHLFESRVLIRHHSYLDTRKL